MTASMRNILASLMIFLIVPSVSSWSLDLSDMPKSICGWPSLYVDGRFPEWSTRMAQRLLANYLKLSDFTVDGVFSNETTNQINQFESLEGLTVNGKLNINSWPQLLSSVTPLTNSDNNRVPIEALQDALAVHGFNTTINGSFDEATVQALSKFQIARGASEVSGRIVDSQTWHLLATGCNNTDVVGSPGHFWVDIGWPQGNVSLSTSQCLLKQGIEFTVHECWREQNGGTFWNACPGNIANAWSAGFTDVGVYMFPSRSGDPYLQGQQFLGNLSTHGVKFGILMLDIEGSDWTTYTIQQNRDFIMQLRSGLAHDSWYHNNWKLSVYVGFEYESFFGEDFYELNDTLLVYPHYDNVPSSYDYDFKPFGGWKAAAGKQFYDGVSPEIICNLPLDWDWSPRPFWSR